MFEIGSIVSLVIAIIQVLNWLIGRGLQLEAKIALALLVLVEELGEGDFLEHALRRHLEQEGDEQVAGAN